MKILLLVFVSLIIIQNVTNAGTNKNRNRSMKKSSAVRTVERTNISQAYKKNVSQLSWYQMITNVPKDNFTFIKNSFKADKLPAYIGVAVLSGSLAIADSRGWKTDNSLYNRYGLYHSAADATVFMGNGEFDFMLSGAFASYGLIAHDNTALKTASNIVEAVLSAGLFVQVLKRITGRESPAATDRTWGDFQFFPSIKEYQKNQSKYYSFPSGHLASATATLTVIANNYPNVKWIKPVGYTLLGLIGLGLASRGMHWYSDLPLGFFIGYSFGNIISPAVSSPLNDIKNSHLSVQPSVGSNSLGLNVAYQF